MSEKTAPTLEFGLTKALPWVVSVAWGARAIPTPERTRMNYRTKRLNVTAKARFDLLWDRQRGIGTTAARKAFQPLVNKALKGAMREYRKLVKRGELTGSDTSMHQLYRDDVVELWASTNASHGYLYLAAFRTEDR